MKRGLWRGEMLLYICTNIFFYQWQVWAGQLAGTIKWTNKHSVTLTFSSVNGVELKIFICKNVKNKLPDLFFYDGCMNVLCLYK